MVIKTKAFFVLFLISFLLAAPGCSFLKAKKTYEQLNQILESGNAAFVAKDYDKAIEFYDAGLRISPKELTFYNAKCSAMRMRAVDLYNRSIRLEDVKAKNDAMDAAKKGMTEASTVSTNAVTILKTRSDLETLLLDRSEFVKTLTLETHAESMRLVATVVDRTRADEALAAMHDYIDNEPDPKKKLKAQLSAGKMLIDSLNGQKAFVEYKKILDDDPDNLDAILGVGMALSQSGQKDDLREAKIFLQRFVEKAPSDHPSMPTVKEILGAI
jgi:tetratricopeptide (TPR) repeat protein